MRQRVDVVVVGGGPAGAATALELAREGVEVVLLDRARFPREKPCGDFLHPLGTAVLEQLGVLAEVGSQAQSLHGMLLVSPQGREVFAPFPGGTGLAVRRAVLDDTVLQAARRAGAEVHTGRPARAVARHGQRWEIRTDQGTLEARVLVGADGMRSRVAQAAGLRRGPLRRGRYALSIYVRGLPAYPGWGEMHLGRETYCGVSLFPDGWARLALVLPREALGAQIRAAQTGKVARVLEDAMRAFPSLRARLPGVQVCAGLRAVGPLHPSTGPVVADGIVLVGDAAACTDPLTGLGVSLALSAASVAARTVAGALRRGECGAPALAPYARWHHRRLRGLTALLCLVDWLALRSSLIEPLTHAWQRRPPLASNFLGAIGGGATPGAVLHPAYAVRLLLACVSRT
ncbi:MAG: geranylgeranyl reductase family protein [Armatimonadota bacterium]|nr:geranylgeranyl reductase family protein [Armatimonadota bacterium]MDR7428339.1 geranylgeranyl reductase family protein [Armatimonadota bacterium]MDR7463207.1 geranylgeranyl reductase family protein [Armatimonadota bacterium]MDR7469413.1 geranylgeranyl reductase family protein [Armatimonadota bacterium]MDR7474751.1 geranylgeranyl reductase family protein [Armatimonadota bacterium]